jgi:hypothetical protein
MRFNVRDFLPSSLFETSDFVNKEKPSVIGLDNARRGSG